MVSCTLSATPNLTPRQYPAVLDLTLKGLPQWRCSNLTHVYVRPMSPQVVNKLSLPCMRCVDDQGLVSLRSWTHKEIIIKQNMMLNVIYLKCIMPQFYHSGYHLCDVPVIRYEVKRQNELELINLIQLQCKKRNWKIEKRNSSRNSNLTFWTKEIGSKN